MAVATGQIATKLCPDDAGRVLVPLSYESRIKIIVTPLQSPEKFKLFHVKKFTFGAKALLSCEEMHKLCIHLAEGNNVVI